MQFEVGQRVCVASGDPVGHCRTPWYLRGKTGVVVTRLGVYRDPVRLAYHKPGLPALPLYKVRFRQTDLWADYRGPASDTLEADIYEPWLAAQT